jgi:multidrug resistance efflux pump
VASGIVESEAGAEEQEQQQQQPAGQRAPMVQKLLDAPNLPAFITDLITTQATTVVGTEAVGFLIEAGGEDGPQMRLLSHVRPDNSSHDVREAAIKAFVELVKPCVKEGKDGAIEIGQGDAYHPESQYCLVTLLRAEGNAVAVSAVITRCMNQERARQRLTSMQLVAGYFELFQLRHTADQARMIAQSHQHVLQLASAVATADGFPSAAMNLCNELANRAGATRVSLGWYKGRNIKVRALSHTEEFDKKQELIVQIERAMEECADQEEIVSFDPTGKSSDNVTREHQALSRSQGGNIVLSFPLRQNAEVRGVVTLEFLPTTKLGPQLSHGLAVAVDLLAPQLYDRYQNDRWLITKAGLSVKSQLEHVTGPRYMTAKLIIFAVIVTALCVTFIKPMYHVSAPFTFSAPDKASISSPFEADLIEVGVNDRGEPLRPGDHVKAGQVLAKLDIHELQSKRFEAMKNYDAAMKERDKDLGDRGKTADAMIAQAHADSAKAQMDLYAYQISQSTITSPFDGLLLKGDLNSRRGQKLQLGEELFEVTPNDRLRLEATVAERDIQNVKIGAKGHLATDALPMDKYTFTVTRIIPVPKAEEGASNFMVYGEADDAEAATGHPDWRPGMAGEVRIDVGQKRLVWIWTHRLIDFLRLKLWM